MKFDDVCAEVMKEGKAFRDSCQKNGLQLGHIKTVGRVRFESEWMPRLLKNFPEEPKKILFLGDGFTPLRNQLFEERTRWSVSGPRATLKLLRITCSSNSPKTTVKDVKTVFTGTAPRKPDYIAFVADECIYCIVPLSKLADALSKYTKMSDLLRYDVHGSTVKEKSLFTVTIIPQGQDCVYSKK